MPNEVEQLHADLERLRRDAEDLSARFRTLAVYGELAALVEDVYRRLVIQTARVTAQLTTSGPEVRQALASEIAAARDAIGVATAAALLLAMQHPIEDRHLARADQGWAGA